MKRFLIPLLLLTGIALPSANLFAQSKPAPMVVHEWGTFTSLQDESGKAIGGINTDDEPVPKFVHRLSDNLLLIPSEVPRTFYQGAPQCHPDVTMRLETPVVYFHPPPGQSALQRLSVTAKFRGGWLSEFYPDAEAIAPGVDGRMFGSLRSNTVSSLAWNNLQVGGDWSGPATTEHVWTAPRAVKAASVRTVAGEEEKFLFYRGVGNINAPISVSRATNPQRLVIHNQCPPEVTDHKPLNLKSLWLVDIATDGKVAFHVEPGLTLNAGGKKGIPSKFQPGDYTVANRAKLEASLHKALVADGLFVDEATALLKTWELSYFKSAGLRLFFLVPREWTDYYLPLTVSVPSEITRTMVGRVELVKPEQRNTLRQLGQISEEDINAEASRLRSLVYGRLETNPKGFNNVFEGRQSLAAYGVSVPKSYQLFLSLGRFRNALILQEAKKRPSPGLESFIEAHGLAGYMPINVPATGEVQK